MKPVETTPGIRGWGRIIEHVRVGDFMYHIFDTLQEHM
jgi:hypothetical protein